MLRVNCSSGVAAELSEYFSFFVPGYKFMQPYKRKVWDGKIRLFNRMNGEINAGLLYAIKGFAMNSGYKVSQEDGPYGLPTEKNKVNHMTLMKMFAKLDLPFMPRDYQYDAITHAIINKRATLVSPTGSGKSFIIYLLMRWYLEEYETGNVLIIVPTTGLVEQMTKDFENYGYDSNLIHKIYSGKDKETNKRIVITTWQSIHRLAPKWFESFGIVFGDECHGFKAKSLSSIMNKAINAEYRFGTTGTLDGTQTHRMVLEGLFGPVHKVTTTKKLQDAKQLAKLDIDIILLEYSEEERARLQSATYQEEIDFIVSYSARNNFIRNLACSLEGNTLVLFNLVDRHGKVLRDLIEDRVGENDNNQKKIFYVSGETKTSDRENVRAIVEKQSNSIIIASLGTFSTGINIKNIHNIVFASPSKSQIRVLQSIGRGLRVSDNGRDTKLYDIADNLRYNGKPNFTLRHSAERVKIYNNEKFPFKLTEVKI